MNLPTINNKMRNSNQNMTNSIQNNDGFGLGIQVFKIQSKKSIDQINNKGKNRNMIKNIQSPNQTYTFKPPVIPKPKILPSIQKSNNKNQRSSIVTSAKNNNTSLMSDYSEKIFQRKGFIVQADKSATPNNSRSLKKRVTLSYQKPGTNTNMLKSGSIKQSLMNRNSNNKTSILTQIKQKSTVLPIRNINNNTNIKNKQNIQQQQAQQQQIQYIDYHSNYMQIIKFYSQFNLAQKQNQKQIRQLKKVKQNQQNEEIFDHIDYLQSLDGVINTVIDNQQKQNYQAKLNKNQQNKNKKKNNNNNFMIVPITGYEMNQYQMFDYYDITTYNIKNNMMGEFKSNNYENVDLNPIQIQDDERQDKYMKKIN